jgi:hypothetical protein
VQKGNVDEEVENSDSTNSINVAILRCKFFFFKESIVDNKIQLVSFLLICTIHLGLPNMLLPFSQN